MVQRIYSKMFTAGRNQQGFTLIELFTAMFLLTTGLLGTAAMTAGVIKTNRSGRNQTTATAIAQSCFQENRRVGYTNAGTTSGSNGCSVGTTTVSLGGVSFTRVLGAVDVSVTNVKTLTVTVSWSEGSAGNKSITLKTSIAS